MSWLEVLFSLFRRPTATTLSPVKNEPPPTPTVRSPIEETVPTPAAPSPAWYPLCEPLTKASETCYLHAYPDPASPLGAALQKAGLWNAYLAGTAAIPQNLTGLSGAPWTCGWGATGDGIEEGTVWTQSRADARLTADLMRFAAAVDSLVKVPLMPQQKAALVDFTFNLGSGALQTSTLLRLLNAGDYDGAADQFELWVHASGKTLPGLVKRRTRDRNLFLTGTWT